MCSIDIIGTYNGGSSNFGKNVTLRRKPSVVDPNTTYTTSEWDSYASNTFDDMGTHTFDGSGSTTDLNYCDSNGHNTNYEYIDFVGLNDLTNSTGTDSGYADYTLQTANVGYGSNTVVLSAGFSGTSYTEHGKCG